MSHTSRRSLLSLIAASAATVPLSALAAAPARAAGTAPAAVEPFPVPAGSAPGLSRVTLPPLDASYFTPVAMTDPLTVTVRPGTPDRTEITSGGARIAMLTHGARTVVLSGPVRTFTENKQPFTEDFRRTLPDPAAPPAARRSWGSSPNGGRWETLGPAASDFSVAPGAGVIVLTTDHVSRHATLEDDEIGDVDVRATGRFDKVPTGQACSFALSFGYQGVPARDSYRARLSFLTTGAVELRVEKEYAGEVTQLAGVTPLATAVPAGADWTIRVRRQGNRFQVKAWRAAAGEPAAWTVETSDKADRTVEPHFTKGRVGLRVLAGEGCSNLPVKLTVSRFQVDAANWEKPPSVTHGDWVRVLPEPFDGDWTPALDHVIRGWAGSTAPDVLAYAAMFLNGAPAVTSGAGPAKDKQVLGAAGYGPLDQRGLRREGADFLDYMATGWTFPDGATAGPAADQAGSLDCSGYVRMVYGYHAGVALAAWTDTTGTAIPRASRHMVDFTPGVRIDRTADGATPPAAARLQPGDLLFFNADSGDDLTTATIDHVGIHLGTDAAGKRRFLSSRKTADGPTMADLGGASLLDGDGTYAKRLHTVHRV
ncbi:NlpC/P60 family protein [Streptomyces sp. ODS05-4]|uniref:NlpC/P60 family protein n=1 Tax=Streptomyces sp. ODS05-4 TaxID=2944939 RepID=UPI00210C7C95|nr:NlpC/P60 family protein [Streptomyces sp. ODS05-4]